MRLHCLWGVIWLGLALVGVNSETNHVCKHKHELRFGQNMPIEHRELRLALRKYEEHHALSTESVNVTEDLLRPINSASEIRNRYMIIKLPQEGLGNKLCQLTSAFLLALFTNRILLVYSEHFEVDELLCQPFANSDWTVPKEWTLQRAKELGHYKVAEFNHDITTAFMRSTDPWSDIQIAHGSSHQYYLPAFFLIPNLMPTMYKWFPTRNVATPLMRFLLHPRDDVWDTIVDTFSKRSATALTIGLQVRNVLVGDILSCVHDIVPQNTHIFIASLANQTQATKALYPDVGVTQKYAENVEQRDILQQKTALHDMFLLSMTDETVIGPGSTFGYVISALKGSPCTIHMNDKAEYDLETSEIVGSEGGKSKCFVERSHEPCFHLAQFFLNAAQPSAELINSTLMHCDDQKISWKLIVDN